MTMCGKDIYINAELTLQSYYVQNDCVPLEMGSTNETCRTQWLKTVVNLELKRKEQRNIRIPMPTLIRGNTKLRVPAYLAATQQDKTCIQVAMDHVHQRKFNVLQKKGYVSVLNTQKGKGKLAAWERNVDYGNVFCSCLSATHIYSNRHGTNLYMGWVNSFSRHGSECDMDYDGSAPCKSCFGSMSCQ